MNEQTTLTDRGNDVKAATEATAKSRRPILSAKPGGVVNQSFNQGFHGVIQAKHLTNLHPPLWMNTLKLHGIPELNSPLAG